MYIYTYAQEFAKFDNRDLKKITYSIFLQLEIKPLWFYLRQNSFSAISNEKYWQRRLSIYELSKTVIREASPIDQVIGYKTKKGSSKENNSYHGVFIDICSSNDRKNNICKNEESFQIFTVNFLFLLNPTLNEIKYLKESTSIEFSMSSFAMYIDFNFNI